MTTTYDPKCYELAELFLSDCPGINTHAKRHELAALIQSTVEGFIEYETNDRPRLEAARNAVSGVIIPGR